MDNKFEKLSCQIPQVQHPAEIRIRKALLIINENCAGCMDCRHDLCAAWAVKKILEGKD